MALKAVLDSLEGLADALKGEYKAGEGGKFYLDVEAATLAPDKVFALENVAGLKKSLQDERNARAAAEQRLTPFTGIDPAAARDALSKVTEMSKWTPEQRVQELLASTKQQLEAKHASEIKSTQETLALREKQLAQTKIHETATRAIIDAGAPESVELLMPHIEKRTRLKLDGAAPIVEVLDEQGNVRISTKPGSSSQMTLEELIDEMKTVPQFKRAFPASGATGSGATGATTTTKTGTTGAPSAPGNKLVIKSSDSAAMSANMEKIASGEVLVDMGT